MQRAFSNHVYGEAHGGKTGGRRRETQREKGREREAGRLLNHVPVNLNEPKQEVRPIVSALVTAAN